MGLITAATRADAKLITCPEDIFDLEGAYEEWVMSEKRDNRQGVFHPSAVGMCGRRNVYEYIRAPQNFRDKPEDLEVFRIGHKVHDLIQGILADLDRVLTPKGLIYTFQAEVPYDRQTDALLQEYGIGGTCDGLLTITDPATGWFQRGVVEVKSSKSETFDKLMEPKKDHRMQANLYAYRFDAPVLWFWYYNKNNSRRKVFREAASDDVLNEALWRFIEQKVHADSGTLPDREESFWACPRCEYADICKPKSLERERARTGLAKLRKKGGFGV